MSVQKHDTFRFQGKDYEIIAKSASGLFSPADFGIKPWWTMSTRMNGYGCEYALSDERLILKYLCIDDTEDGNLPPINGIEASVFEHGGGGVYRDVYLPIPYTGKILLGDDFIWEYRTHMGYQNAWAYGKLIELIFVEGLLIEFRYISHLAKAQRGIMEKQGENPRNLRVEDRFSLNYWKIRWVDKETPFGDW